jgi:hypothetical protein
MVNVPPCLFGYFMAAHSTALLLPEPKHKQSSFTLH